jgi:shikimate dehydrogenase
MGDLTADLLVNVTPLGMAGGVEAETLAFDDAAIKVARMVFDVVALPAETPLIRRGQEHGKPVITGAEVFAIQAVEQFALYTGVRPDDALFNRAAAYARG